MTNPERDLHEALDRLVAAPPPPLRSDEVLAAGRQARRRRSLLAGGGTVAAVLAVVAAAAALPSAAPEPDPGGGIVAGSTTAPAGAGWPQPEVPGLSAAEVRRIARGCAQSFGGANGRIGTATPTPDPSVTPRPETTLVNDPSAPLLADVVRLHALARAEAGTFALLYGPGVALTCQVDGRDLRYNAGGSIGDPHVTAWLPGPVSIDSRSGAEGVQLVAGRVVGSVTRVEVVSGSHRVTVPAVNGTYIALVPAAGDGPGLGVRAYAGGLLVGETSGTSIEECHVTPDGVRIGGDRTDPDQRCKPAVRWR